MLPAYYTISVQLESFSFLLINYGEYNKLTIIMTMMDNYYLHDKIWYISVIN